MVTRQQHGLKLVLLFLVLGISQGLADAAGKSETSKLRVLIETDAGGDPDDEQSLVRFLLYANEWDVEGIIANRPKTRRPENRNSEATGLGVVRKLVAAYGECYPTLVRHDPNYPPPTDLLARTVAGYADTDDGVNLILQAVDRDDSRPLWYADWGSDNGAAPNNLRRALDLVRKERGQRGYAAFKNKLRVISAKNLFGEHATTLDPPFPLYLNTFWPELERKRWYHRFSPLTAKAGGFNLEKDVLTGHGPLGRLYPTDTTLPQKEGDTFTFLYLVPTGMNDPEQPEWGSWAGRYGPGRELGERTAYWANLADTWRGSTHRDNTVLRWAEHLQNDFRMRLEWCVKHPEQTVHPPRLTVNGDATNEIVYLHRPAGAEIELSAANLNSSPVTYEWAIYPEPGSYSGPPPILGGAQKPTARLQIPHDAGGKTLHVIVSGTVANGGPTRYRRVVITATDPVTTHDSIARYFSPPAALANSMGRYRSPLLFNNGAKVKTAADWQRRRQELVRDWESIMGPWPELIRKPRVEILRESKRTEFTQKRVRLEIAVGQSAEGWLLIPAGQGPFPAVLVVYYEPETSIGQNPAQPQRDFALQLARRGFVTLSIGTPGGNAWKPDVGNAVCQPLSFHAYVAANCWHALAGLPDVDSRRIGVVGHSYGGKWAMFAAALWDKFACVAVSDPGIVFDEARPSVNYWEPWYLGLDPHMTQRRPGVPTAQNPRTGAYKRLVEAGRDLHELHALIAPRPFLVSGGSEDPPQRWTALNHLVAVNKVLGFENRVAMTNRKDHTPSVDSNRQLYAFFEHFLLNQGQERPASTFRSPEGKRKLVRIASTQPRNRSLDFRLQPAEVLRLVDQSLVELEELAQDAARRGADVVVFPEDTLGLGRWEAANPTLHKEVLPKAVEAMLHKFGQAAASFHVYVICCNDAFAEDGKLYNTAFFLGRDGRLIGRYEKVQPTIHESRRQRGSRFPVFPTSDLGGVGMLICYDMVFPESTRCLALGGADIIFHPTLGGAAIGDGDISLAAFRTRAVENFVYIVVSQRGSGSMIISPQGKILVQAIGPDSMAVADIDPFGGREGGDAFNHQKDMRARLFRERTPSAYGILADPSPPVLKKIPATIEPEEAIRIAERGITVGEEEFKAAEALARTGKTREAVAAFERLRKEYRASWIDRVSAERLRTLRKSR